MTLAQGEDSGLVARVLAGDRQAMRLLDLLNSFTPAQTEAFLRCGQRIAQGMAVAEAGMLMYRECGHSDAEATALLKLASPSGVLASG